jgi:hypothetical protein
MLALVASIATTPARAEASFGFFYSNLEPHGSWHVSARYGQVWQPAVHARGWNPYYDGHWLYTDVGWTWASDYPWGAIPYHYGTWVVDPAYGWVWVPGYTWAPAWVTFRTGPDYIGWAPVAPAFSASFTLGSRWPASSAYVFVPARSFLAPHVRTYVVPASRTRVAYRHANVVTAPVVRNHTVFTRGPDVRSVERATGHPVRPSRIEHVSRVTAVDRTVARSGARATEPRRKDSVIASNKRYEPSPRRAEPQRQPRAMKHQAKPKHGPDKH